MRNLKILGVLLSTAALLLALPFTAYGDSRVTITTTVDAQLVSIVSDTTSVHFGTLGSGAIQPSQNMTLTNNGTTPVKLKAATTNAIGPTGAEWLLVSGSPGVDEYRMDLVDVNGATVTTTPLATFATTWPTDPTIDVSGSRTFRLAIWMGSSTTLGTFSAPVSITAYAP